MGRRPGRIKKDHLSSSKNQREVGPGRKKLFLPGVLSSGFLPKKAAPARSRAGNHVAGPTLRRSKPRPPADTEIPRIKRRNPNGNPTIRLSLPGRAGPAAGPAVYGGVESLRPVLRINAELRGGPAGTVYLELNTPVAAFGKRGWWNVGRWESPAHPLTARQEGAATTLPGSLPHPHLHPNRGGGRLPGREGQRRLLLPPKRGSPALSRRRPSPPPGPSATWTSNGPLPRGCPGPQPEQGRPCHLSHPAKGPVPPGSP